MIDPTAVKLIIFDCDGVLVDTETLANQVLYQHLQAKGLRYSLSEMTQLFWGLSFTDMQVRAQQHFDMQFNDHFWTQVQQDTFSSFRLNLQPNPATLELLKALKQPYCVASSDSHVKMTLTLTLTGLLAAFENRRFSAEQVSRGKPAPDLFLLVANHYGVTPAQCLVIEDSPTGCEAAEAAGMQLLAYKAEASLRFPDVITDLRGLLNILG